MSDAHWKIGANYLIRTATMIDAGKLVAVTEHELVLEDASWIADTGRFGKALETSSFNEVEMFPTGQVIVDFLNRKLPAYLETGLNWVHVRDVAVGHILAAEKGQVGERYILGNKAGNWTMEKTLRTLEEITGIPAPKMKIPHWVALAAAHVDEGTSFFTRKPPKAPLAGVRMAKYKMYFSPAKAIRELGLPQTHPQQALADAVDWFRRNGYVK